jgi:phosphoesterase RecJ-like protein
MRESTGKYRKELSESFERSQNISLVCHTNPDGDAIGSMLGLYHYLKSKGKDCIMISPTPLQGFLLWMRGVQDILIYSDNPKIVKASLAETELLIMLDFNHPSRLGRAQFLMNLDINRRILIDHHPVPEVKADLVISEPKFSSTAELVYDLVTHLEGNDFVYEPFADAIYVGMMTDTGNFSFGSYDGETLRIVSTMLDNGLDKDKITDLVYDNFSADRMRLKGFALSERMVVLPEFRTAYIYLSMDDLLRFRHKVGDTEGFVNMPLSIKDIDMAVLFLEKEDHVKLSLRSKGEFSVNELSRQYFNGGGHRNAAGGRSELSLKESIKYFESILSVFRKKDS